MRRIALILLSLAAAAAGGATAATGADDVHTYKIEMYNAFGLVPGSDIRVAGVNVGSIQDLTINESKRAVVTAELNGDLAQLGERTTCTSEPQSLIAEYFLDCQPAGEPLEDGALIPASRVQQTVQPDIVANTMREPFRRRFTLLINEFGTALAGNPDNLNEAIRLGAPALTELKQATRILASQNELMRDLNVDSEKVSRELALYKDQIVEFVDEAEDVARTALERREEVSRGFDIFDDYVAELKPTLTQLRETADQQAPMLASLRVAAPELHRLSVSLPPFQRASEGALLSLGDAAVVGERALRRGRDEIELLAKAGRRAPVTTEILADALRDLDDPRRAVEINDLAERTTGRTGEQPGTRNTKGYTGFEGLLNYPYYQALSINQFDRAAHSLHIGLYEVNTGPCGAFSSGRDPETGEAGVPAEDGGLTTDFFELARCSNWLGPNQPGITELRDLPKYHPSVCPNGTHPEHAREHLCDPGGETEARRKRRGGDGRVTSDERPGSPDRSEGEDGPRGEGSTPIPSPDDVIEQLEDLLDLPTGALEQLGLDRARPGSAGSEQAAEKLVDFLFGP